MILVHKFELTTVSFYDIFSPMDHNLIGITSDSLCNSRFILSTYKNINRITTQHTYLISRYRSVFSLFIFFLHFFISSFSWVIRTNCQRVHYTRCINSMNKTRLLFDKQFTQSIIFRTICFPCT